MISVYGMGLVTIGLTADAGGAIALGLDWRSKPAAPSEWAPTFSLGLELRVSLPGRVYALEPVPYAMPTGAPVEMDISTYTALLVPCARIGAYFFGCGVLQGGALFTDVPRGEQRALPMLALGPRLGVEVPLDDRFALFALGEALFTPVIRSVDFVLPSPSGNPPSNTRWTHPVASGYLGAGVAVKFE